MFSCSHNTGTVEHSWMFEWTKPKLTVSHGPACPPRWRLTRQCQPEWDLGWVQTGLLPLSRKSRIPADPYGPAHGSPLPSFSVNAHTGHCGMMHTRMQNNSCTGSISSLVTLLAFFPWLTSDETLLFIYLIVWGRSLVSDRWLSLWFDLCRRLFSLVLAHPVSPVDFDEPSAAL